jgi:hypothetical protein
MIQADTGQMLALPCRLSGAAPPGDFTRALTLA